MRTNKFIVVIFKDNPNKKYLFITEDMEVKVKDLVLCDTAKGINLGIVVNGDGNASLANDPSVNKPIKSASYACDSSHELSTSRNAFLKSYCKHLENRLSPQD